MSDRSIQVSNVYKAFEFDDDNNPSVLDPSVTGGLIKGSPVTTVGATGTDMNFPTEQATREAIAVEAARATGVETGLDTRTTTLEGSIGGIETSLGASTDVADEDGSLYARVHANDVELLAIETDKQDVINTSANTPATIVEQIANSVVDITGKANIDLGNISTGGTALIDGRVTSIVSGRATVDLDNLTDAGTMVITDLIPDSQDISGLADRDLSNLTSTTVITDLIPDPVDISGKLDRTQLLPATVETLSDTTIINTADRTDELLSFHIGGFTVVTPELHDSGLTVLSVGTNFFRVTGIHPYPRNSTLRINGKTITVTSHLLEIISGVVQTTVSYTGTAIIAEDVGQPVFTEEDEMVHIDEQEYADGIIPVFDGSKVTLSTEVTAANLVTTIAAIPAAPVTSVNGMVGVVVIPETDLSEVERDIERARIKFERAGATFEAFGSNIMHGHTGNTVADREMIVLTFAANEEAQQFADFIRDEPIQAIGTDGGDFGRVIGTMVNVVDGGNNTLTVYFGEAFIINSGDALGRVVINEVDIARIRVASGSLEFEEADGTVNTFTPTGGDGGGTTAAPLRYVEILAGAPAPTTFTGTLPAGFTSGLNYVYLTVTYNRFFNATGESLREGSTVIFSKEYA